MSAGVTYDGVLAVGPGLALRFDATANPILYLAEAPTGAAEDIATWRIMRITTSDTSVTIEWAEGSNQFNYKWSERAILPYS